ncbi:MAG: hypothetical protein AABZ74_14965 [Cyanobacteriota bacterium]
MTTSTAGVRLGGSGYSYGDYQLPDSKRSVIEDEDQRQGKPLTLAEKAAKKEKEIEIFLFTIRDPVRSIISKLMDVIAIHGNAPLPQIDIQLAPTGPLGYTSLFAFQPVQTPKSPDGILRATFR